MANFDVVGKAFPRKDAYDKVTGRAKYVADLRMPDLLYGKILHSPVAHARITHIDTTKAKALPGVVCVVTYEDVPDIPFTYCGHPYPFDTPLDTKILNQHVRFVGDNIAAVAAETPEIAEEALRLITFDYEELPIMLTPEAALAPDAMEIHEGSRNIAGENAFDIGDPDACFARAAYIHEDEFDTPVVTHCQIENHVSLVEPDPGHKRWILHCSNQVPNILRERLTYAVGLPLRALKVVKGFVGGGFGGKQEPVFEHINLFLAMTCNRPVLMEATREENLAMTRTRHGDHIRIRSALDENFTLIGREVEIIANTGAYSSHGHNVVYAQAAHSNVLYSVPNLRFIGKSVYTNTLIAGAMRGYGAPQWHFAMEAHVDNICRKWGLDPFDFRLKNACTVDSPLYASFINVNTSGLREAMALGRKEIGWDSFNPGPQTGDIRRGIGMSIISYGQSCYPHSVELSAARVKVNEDGSATVFSGATEIGQGTETIFMQIAAEALGVPFDWITMPDEVDTDVTPFDPGAYASRQTYVAGMAVKKAALACKNDILDYISEKRGWERGLLDAHMGQIVNVRTGQVLCPLKDVTWDMYYSHPRATSIEHEACHYPTDNPMTFGAAFAQVAVDVGTGEVTVEKLRTYLDSGTIINPQTAKGQLLGGAIMCYGYGMTEQIKINPQTGAVYNDNLLDYKIPTFADVPDLDGSFIETYEPTSAYGNKSLGEPPNIAPAPAIRNAVVNATGTIINKLPLTPENVWLALHPEPERS
ncbi:MAG: molybdopterin-dependent oxidoreductase [Lachnospiraceae bacterium]|nr:molybdopterin-dependent oxidoreductase [Lachnospiraceae bacterium]